jgi:hypothetical protein
LASVGGKVAAIARTEGVGQSEKGGGLTRRRPLMKQKRAIYRLRVSSGVWQRPEE